MVCGCLNCSATCSGLKGNLPVIQLFDSIWGKTSKKKKKGTLRLSSSGRRNVEHSVLITAHYLHQSCDRTYVGHYIMETETKNPTLSGLCVM